MGDVAQVRVSRRVPVKKPSFGIMSIVFCIVCQFNLMTKDQKFSSTDSIHSRLSQTQLDTCTTNLSELFLILLMYQQADRQLYQYTAFLALAYPSMHDCFLYGHWSPWNREMRSAASGAPFSSHQIVIKSPLNKCQPEDTNHRPALERSHRCIVEAPDEKRLEELLQHRSQSTSRHCLL